MSAKTEEARARRGLDSGEVPSWVQQDAACRYAWAQDKSWRKAARSALPPAHRPPGDGGTTGDALVARAQRAYQQAGGGRREAGAQRHHAAECPCNPCRKRRGEKALPTLRQQQERRKRSCGVEPGDREEWLLSSDARVRFARLAEVSHDEQRKHLFVLLRTAFVQHLDAWRLFGALERLLEERPAWGAALVACDLQGRPTKEVAKDEGVTCGTLRTRRRRARAYLAALYEGSEPPASRLPPPASRGAGTGATRAGLEDAARAAQCRSVADYVRRIVLEPL